ncbi:hypothetical protein GLU64_02375 [Nanohaloarchaea archaeon]|jgi:endogenous inhibitor of DNA gyrase (YacG/DUF329 family)|nr:hypothetical protein [Candidatus Nanohaloarchaea archaeon]
MSPETKMSKCVFCGENATKKNSEGQPVCNEHKESDPKSVACPECGLPMKIKEGRYGFFWGCEGYPNCKQTFQIEAVVEKDEN